MSRSAYLAGPTFCILFFRLCFADPIIGMSIVGTTRGLPSTLVCKIARYDISAATAWYKTSSQSDLGDPVLICNGTNCLPSRNVERYTFNRKVTGMYLTIKQPTRTLDHGWWRCVLTSVSPNVQIYGYLNVYKPTIDISIVGTTRTLVCMITGYDISGTTAWYKTSSNADPGQDPVLLCDGESCLTSENAERYEFSRNGTGMYLTIKQLDRRPWDQGWWRCVLQSATPVVQKYAFLTVYSSPGGVSYNSSPTGPTDLGVDSFSIQCRTDHCTYPQPKFGWFYRENRARMEYSGGQQQGTESSTGCTGSEKIYTNTLTIPQLTVFQGHVDKTVSFICGMNHQSIGWFYTAASQTVRFAFNPDVEVRIGGSRYETYNVQEQNAVELICHTLTANPSPSSYTWKKGSETVQGSTGAILRISPVKRVDDDNFLCVANNGVGSGTSQSVHLNVQYMPAITNFDVIGPDCVSENPRIYETYEGANATMICTVDSNPVSNITWTRQDSDNVILTVQQTLESRLDLSEVVCSQATSFSCTAMNVIGLSSSSVKLSVRCHPRLVPASSIVYGKIGGNVRLTVTVIAHPAPVFTWYKLDKTGKKEQLPAPASQSDESLSSNLTIPNMKDEYFSGYGVQVSNKLKPDLQYQFLVTPEVEPETNSVSISSSSSIGLVAGVAVAAFVLGCILTFIVVKYHTVWRRKLCREFVYAEAKPNSGEHTYAEVEGGAAAAVALGHISPEHLEQESGPRTYENV